MQRTKNEQRRIQVRLQAYRFEWRPDRKQRHQMRAFAGSCGFVFNRALALPKELFELSGAHAVLLCGVRPGSQRRSGGSNQCRKGWTSPDRLWSERWSQVVSRRNPARSRPSRDAWIPPPSGGGGRQEPWFSKPGRLWRRSQPGRYRNTDRWL